MQDIFAIDGKLKIGYFHIKEISIINYFKANDVENEIQIQILDDLVIKGGQEFKVTIDQNGILKLTPIKNDLEDE